MYYTLYMDHDIDRQRNVTDATMDLLRYLVARFPEVTGAQFIQAVDDGVYVPASVCNDTAEVLQSQSLEPMVEAAEKVGLGHCDPSELCELVWEIAEFFADAGEEYGVYISR
jgi:hypothetical protein